MPLVDFHHDLKSAIELLDLCIVSKGKLGVAAFHELNTSYIPNCDCKIDCLPRSSLKDC